MLPTWMLGLPARTHALARFHIGWASVFETMATPALSETVTPASGSGAVQAPRRSVQASAECLVGPRSDTVGVKRWRGGLPSPPRARSFPAGPAWGCPPTYGAGARGLRIRPAPAGYAAADRERARRGAMDVHQGIGFVNIVVCVKR